MTLPATGIGIAVIAANYHKFSWPSQIFAIGSLTGRIDLWLKTIDLMKKHWFTGLGLGSWAEAFLNRFGESNIHVHNSYIQLYADTGLIGALAFIVAAALFLRISWRMIRVPRQGYWYGLGVGVIGGMLAGAAASIFDVITYGAFINPDYHYLSIPLLWVMAALFVISYRHIRDQVHTKITRKGKLAFQGNAIYGGTM